MSQSFKVARIAGTEVRIHFTFLLLHAWIGIATAAFNGVLFLLLIFLCGLLHEFGHVAAALRYGITTPRITLLPFGGVAQLSRIPKQPTHELVAAIAGPLVNVVIAGVLILVRKGFPEWSDVGGMPGGANILDGLIWVNLILVAFNLTPAFPMDGGRAFRAFLSYFVSREKANISPRSNIFRPPITPSLPSLDHAGKPVENFRLAETLPE
ncbi:MAG: site-2 protease family protein [Verrucomicrobiales bacterium]|nr:site-2 protease family protein [Verrucomicrobiales bacterium]